MSLTKSRFEPSKIKNGRSKYRISMGKKFSRMLKAILKRGKILSLVVESLTFWLKGLMPEFTVGSNKMAADAKKAGSFGIFFI